MWYKQVTAAQRLCQRKKLVDVLRFELLQKRSADTKETGQTASHHQVELAGTLLLESALAFVEVIVVVKDWLSEQQHSIVAQLMLVKTPVAWMLLLTSTNQGVSTAVAMGREGRNLLTIIELHNVPFTKQQFIQKHQAPYIVKRRIKVYHYC